MKYWTRALRDLENSDKSMQAIYNIVCSFNTNIFFEKLDGTAIKTTTYAEFNKQTHAAASQISRLVNAEKGAFVGLEMNNSPEWVVSFWAILMAGYKPVLVNTRLPKEQIEYILSETKAVKVVSDKPHREMDINVADIMQGGDESFEVAFDDAFALTTSGTQGVPKIFIYNGKAMSAQVFNTGYVLKENSTIKCYYKGYAKLLAFLPFYHIFGLVATLMWFSFFGRTFVFLQDMRPETIQYAVQRHGVTHLFAIPILFNGVSSHVLRTAKKDGQEEKLNKALNFSIKLQSVLPRSSKWIVAKMFKSVRSKLFGESLKFCICGGGYIKDEALKVFNGVGYSLYNGYGMTEIGIASVELRLNATKRIQGSVGKPMPSVEYNLEDGKLRVKGKSIHTAQIINGEMVERNEDDWFYTNDIFTCDEHGYYFINGRTDDMIIADNGEIIVPDLIEKRFEMPFAKSFTVIGVKKKTTEVVMVMYPDEKATPQQIDNMLITAHEVNNTLPLADQISKVYITKQPLPLALESKVQRGLLREMIASDGISYVAVDLSKYSNVDDILDENFKKLEGEVKGVFSSVLALEEEVGNHANFITDLGGSSLEYFSLLDELSKKYNVTFKLEEQFLATPHEFAQYILAQSN